jgi:hypothetical protein
MGKKKKKIFCITKMGIIHLTWDEGREMVNYRFDAGG